MLVGLPNTKLDVLALISILAVSGIYVGGWFGEGTFGEVEALFVGSGITAGDNFGSSRRCGGSLGFTGSNVSIRDLPPRAESLELLTCTPPGAKGGTGM